MMSTSADQPSAPTSRVGAELRAARDRIGWGLPDVAAGLRIRLPYLEAIEAGRLSDLPGNAYALGFVRSYAQALGLDPDEIARRFRAEAAEVNRRTELDFPAPVPERGMPAGAMILLGVLLTVGAYVAWYRSSDRQPNAEPVRAVPERLAPLAETAPPPATPAPAPATEAPAPHASPTVAAAAMPSPGQLAQPAPPAAGVVPAAAVPPALPDGTRLVLRAKADAWMQVRDKQGQVLLNRILRAGETWPVPPAKALLLTTGNAGGTEILLDGNAIPSIGADGAVRRDLPLDPDTARDGKLAPQPVAVRPPAPKPAPPPAPPAGVGEPHQL